MLIHVPIVYAADGDMIVSGALGVGTGATPAGKLNLQSGANHDYLYIDADFSYQSAISLRDNTSGQDVVLYRPSNTRDYRIYTPTAGDVFSLTQNGSVGIGAGTTAPNAKLQVKGSLSLGSGASPSPATPGKALCVLSSGIIGYCSTAIDANGSCLCNGIN